MATEIDWEATYDEWLNHGSPQPHSEELAEDWRNIAHGLREENERLKCCGNCRNSNWCLLELSDGTSIQGDDGMWCKFECEPRILASLQPSDHCHFTPSCWKEREG